jgi:tetratricopeptide (TPR) repeat protein
MFLRAVMILAFVQPAPEAEPWYRHYEQGVALVQQGRGAEARRALEAALEARGEEGLRVHTQGPQVVDYLPHLYLAIACHLQGDPEAARRHLQKAERGGTAERSEVGRSLLQAYRLLLETPAEAPDEAARFKVYPKRPGVLPEKDVEAIAAVVAARCRVPASRPRQGAPWYFHYELGLELARRGDPQRALDALVEAVNRRGEPQHGARLYGVWFLDYLPYFHIARAHALLGNWECAADALALSERKTEVSARDAEYADLRELAREIGLHTKR